MQFSELYGSALTLELGSSDTTELFTTVLRKSAINTAQNEFNRLTECFTKRISTISVTDGVAEYDLEAVISAADYQWIAKDGIEIAIVTSSSTTYLSGPTLQRRDIDWLNRSRPGWRTETAGRPDSYYLRQDGGALNLGMVSTPDVLAGETWTLWVTYVANVPAMSADADLPFTASSNALKALIPWHQALVHYAAAKLELLRKNTDGETIQMQKFGGYVADYLQRQRIKGGTHVQFARNYNQERAVRGFVDPRTMDPRRWP